MYRYGGYDFLFEGMDQRFMFGLFQYQVVWRACSCELFQVLQCGEVVKSNLKWKQSNVITVDRLHPG